MRIKHGFDKKYHREEKNTEQQLSTKMNIIYNIWPEWSRSHRVNSIRLLNTDFDDDKQTINT